MRVLVTGGAGFIGSACLAELIQQGEECVVIDAFDTTLYSRERKESNLEWAREFGDFRFFEMDIRNESGLESVFTEYDFDCVVHLAALAGVRPSIENAPRYFDTNVTGTSTLLEIARRSGVENFVIASSSSVYGGNEKTPFSEEDPVEAPISPYAASKRAKELLAQTHSHLHGSNISCLRFFTVYGPRQRPEMAIHKFMRLLDLGEPIPMYGDGSSGRDYTYIDDISSGVMSAIETLDGFRVYNLGGDRVTRLSELIQEIGDVMGVEPDVEQLPEQPGDVPITNADLTRSRRELGYTPNTSLREGLEAMWDWYRTTREKFYPVSF